VVLAEAETAVASEKREAMALPIRVAAVVALVEKRGM
jgi:hypothetical protein